MTSELIRTYWPIVVVTGSLVGAAIYAWLTNRFATINDQKKLEHRVQEMEKKIAAAPDWHEMDKRLERVSTQNEAILRSLNGIEERVAMLYENEFRQEQKQ